MENRLEKIKEEYSKFHIPSEQIPFYENIESFSKSFKRCSIVDYGIISYSNNTIQIPNNKEEELCQIGIKS